MSYKKLIVLMMLLGSVTSAFAAGKTREFSLDGNYISVQGQPFASLLNVSLGQFVTPQFVIVTALTTQQNFGYSATSIGLGGKYYFMDGFKGDLVPFAGLGIALRLAATPTDSNHGSTQYDAGLGLAFFLTDSATLDAKVRVLNFNDSSPTVTLFSAGFTQRF
ncbi:MAG TPA: hypothetical protein VMV48_08460 [Gallionellaceae bacterium]|nr:hypothetical protein [Gallionellaceae bacterium]